MPAIQEQRFEDRKVAKEFGATQHHATDPGPSTPPTADSHVTSDSPASAAFGRHKDDLHVDINESADGVTKRGKFKKIFQSKYENDILDDETLANQDSEDLSVEERKRKAHKRKIPVGQQFRFIVFHQWTYVALLAFIPTGFALYYTHANVVAVFCVNFIAIIPSAAMLSNAVGELSIRLGDNMGALLNMTFG